MPTSLSPLIELTKLNLNYLEQREYKVSLYPVVFRPMYSFKICQSINFLSISRSSTLQSWQNMGFEADLSIHLQLTFQPPVNSISLIVILGYYHYPLSSLG